MHGRKAERAHEDPLPQAKEEEIARIAQWKAEKVWGCNAIALASGPYSALNPSQLDAPARVGQV